ncbi:hypothetical protein LTV02_03160 [Nocardia yamanashiensis]|uniref:hypothetical protein n=1 Tax=Nocardia yamanashiensis TaxID=209247 RepID=UPI001E481108|nr:hypothetical protein [Nocardia yamanashiensis]UGT42435.1 hypothetical protein LTV02_03160 [Nocardia yamanashiensis]
MSDPRDGSTMIEGRVVHSVSNALRITFRSGPGDPLAVGVQGAGDGFTAKLGILFGFKNGGTGRHRITYADGSSIWVHSKDGAPTVLTRADGTAIGTIQRADTSTAVASTAGTLFHFVPLPDTAPAPDRYRLRILDRMGEEAGRLDVIRTPDGWTPGHLANDLADTYIWWDRAGQPLPTPILGTRLVTRRPLDPDERDILLGVCADIALGLRPYIATMKH